MDDFSSIMMQSAVPSSETDMSIASAVTSSLELHSAEQAMQQDWPPQEVYSAHAQPFSACYDYIQNPAIQSPTHSELSSNSGSDANSYFSDNHGYPYAGIQPNTYYNTSCSMSPPISQFESDKEGSCSSIQATADHTTSSMGTAPTLKRGRPARHPATKAPTSKKRKRVINKEQRVAANHRERNRMGSMNQAFEQLKERIPNIKDDKRMSRIDTLRLAMAYISFMSDLVNDPTATPPHMMPQNPFEHYPQVPMPTCYYT